MNGQNQVSNDLRRSARQAKRIDYKQFNETGVIKEVQYSDDTDKVVPDVDDIIDNDNVTNRSNQGQLIESTLIENTTFQHTLTFTNYESREDIRASVRTINYSR